MNRKNRQNSKNEQQTFQKLWEQFKDHHKTEKYVLKEIFDIYLPFWQCKQNIVVEKDVELDRFSRIILELIQNNVTKHSEICDFLGVDRDSFVITQFHFLLKNDFIRELDDDKYELTHEGISFLQNKTKAKSNETIEFEYFVTEKMNYLKNDLTQDFFDPSSPIDKQLSKKKKSNFSGYEIMQSHRIQKSESSKEIPHKNKPTYRLINEKRSDFSAFFNTKFRDKTFYDFADNKIDTHKRNICFYGLLYENVENQDDKKLDIRHSLKSLKQFKNNDLETALTNKTTHYLMENPDFIL